ncbi:MAG: hypothetical protein KDI88_17495, partial [Gammaproteobacteria bacterium]|nr:hypothetical protein [Gammaproteobacteria bacterium]
MVFIDHPGTLCCSETVSLTALRLISSPVMTEAVTGVRSTTSDCQRGEMMIVIGSSVTESPAAMDSACQSATGDWQKSVLPANSTVLTDREDGQPGIRAQNHDVGN